MKHTQNGFSLIEILLVLGIIIGFAIGAFFLYQSLSLKSNINLEYNNYIQIKENVLQLSQIEPNLLRADADIRNTVIPKESLGNIKTGYNLKTYLNRSNAATAPFAYDSSFYNSWSVRYYDLNQDQCLALVQKLEPVSDYILNVDNEIKAINKPKNKDVPFNKKVMAKACEHGVSQIDFGFVF